ncbi:MAG TPA: FecR domain-containing protein, partial [Candidatus Nanoarchaeia archaeon]|nr:FecR domain-containing protein [Candidatus Nanoarchaeia archaeon]
SENDKVKTENGRATLVLYDSVLISLNPNTEVIINDLTKQYPKVKQTQGSTWTKFADVVGVKNVDIETPDTVATVRNTEFGVEITETGTVVVVIEGTVDVTGNGKVFSVKEFNQAVVKEGADAVLTGITPEQLAKGIENSEKILVTLKELRNKEVFEQTLLIEQAKKRADFTEEDIKQWLEDIDAGKIDDNEVIAKSPVKPPVLYKVKEMNDNIKEQQVLIATLKNR